MSGEPANLSANAPPACAPPWPTWADLGGQRGFGRVVPEPEALAVHWHAAWEPRALAVTLAAGAMGQWNIDMSRAARETLPDYAHLSYYEIWTLALERMLQERGLVSADELAAGTALHPARPVARVLRATDVAQVLARGSPTERPGAPPPPRFALGERVRTRADAAPHHTRLPAYARGKVGVIEALRGRHVFADAHGMGRGEQPEWLYTVVFEGAALWTNNEPGTAQVRLSIDAWEPYLEPCPGSETPPGTQGPQ